MRVVCVVNAHTVQLRSSEDVEIFLHGEDAALAKVNDDACLCLSPVPTAAARLVALRLLCRHLVLVIVLPRVLCCSEGYNRCAGTSASRLVALNRRTPRACALLLQAKAGKAEPKTTPSGKPASGFMTFFKESVQTLSNNL
mgnify:CR=1 FL=1